MFWNVLGIVFFLCMMGFLLWVLEGCPNLRAPRCSLSGKRLLSSEFPDNRTDDDGLVWCPACQARVSSKGEHRMKNPKASRTAYDDPGF